MTQYENERQYYPIVPSRLVGDFPEGITGYSTFVPNCNPLDIVELLTQEILDVD